MTLGKQTTKRTMSKSLGLTAGMVAVLTVAVSSPASATSALDIDVDTGALTESLNSPNIKERIRVLKDIYASALPDETVFTLIDTQLRDKLAKSDMPKSERDEVAWMCKVLGATGNDAYRGVILEVVDKSPHRRTRNHCKNSANDMASWQEKMTFIADESNRVPDVVYNHRVRNMILTNDNYLQRKAAAHVVNVGAQTPVFDAIAEQLATYLPDAAESSMSNREESTLGWLCRALGTSGDAKYVDILEQANKSAQSRAKRHCARALKALQ